MTTATPTTANPERLQALQTQEGFEQAVQKLVSRGFAQDIAITRLNDHLRNHGITPKDFTAERVAEITVQALPEVITPELNPELADSHETLAAVTETIEADPVVAKPVKEPKAVKVKAVKEPKVAKAPRTPKDPGKPVWLSVPDDVHEWLQATAKAKGISAAKYMRGLLDAAKAAS